MIPAIAAINLWNPTHVAGFAIVATAFVLGMVHGVTPDEDTWPITFSCSIGGCSTRRGLRSGLTYSLAFTVQRAAAIELAYLGLAHVFTFASVDYVVYLVVGSLMVAAGLVVHRRHIIPLHLLGRLHLPGLRSHPAGDEDTERPAALRGPRPWMPAAHGFVAGWGFGAFALIIYTVLAPAEHSAAWGWVPGAFFGLGTMAVQILAGGLFGLVAAGGASARTRSGGWRFGRQATRPPGAGSRSSAVAPSGSPSPPPLASTFPPGSTSTTTTTSASHSSSSWSASLASASRLSSARPRRRPEPTRWAYRCAGQPADTPPRRATAQRPGSTPGSP